MLEGLFRPTHLLLILAVALLVFGPNKLPQLGEALGKTIKDFKKAMNEPSQESNGQATSKTLDDKNG
jgi:sec-independent protein translocase protein TatA